MRDFDLASLVLPALEVGPEGWTSKPNQEANNQGSIQHEGASWTWCRKLRVHNVQCAK